MVTYWHHFPDVDRHHIILVLPKGHLFSVNGLRLHPLRVGTSVLAPDDVVIFIIGDSDVMTLVQHLT